MSLAGIAWSAAGAVFVVLLAVQLISLATPGRGFLGSVILGKDGRTSTSKTFVLMWTLLVAWALAALLIAGELVPAHHCVPPSYTSSAAAKCKGDEVGLLQVGWLSFLHSGLSGSYLVLLGVPGAAAVAAKGITVSQVTGSGSKPPKPDGANPISRVAEIFSADDGTTDIGDFQYVIFNLITAAYFVVQFLNPNGNGLPTMPDTLLGLTSVSAGLYVGKKAVSRTQPAVTGVFPMPLHDNSVFTVTGTELTEDPASPTEVKPQLTIDGMLATAVTQNGDQITARAPADLQTGGALTPRKLVVRNPYGGIAPEFTVQCQ